MSRRFGFTGKAPWSADGRVLRGETVPLDGKVCCLLSYVAFFDGGSIGYHTDKGSSEAFHRQRLEVIRRADPLLTALSGPDLYAAARLTDPRMEAYAQCRLPTTIGMVLTWFWSRS